MPPTPPLLGTIRKKSTLSVGVRMVTPHRTPRSSTTNRFAWKKKKKQKLTPEEVGKLRQRHDILGGSSSRAPGHAAGYNSCSEYVDSLSSDSEIEVIDMIHHRKLRVHARPRTYMPARVHTCPPAYIHARPRPYMPANTPGNMPAIMHAMAIYI